MNSTPACSKPFGKYLVIDGEYIWKYTHNAYDFSVLGNTPITFPIQWHNSKIPGIRAAREHAEFTTASARSSSCRASQRDSSRRKSGEPERLLMRQRGVPHRPRRKLTTDDTPAVSALEIRAMDWLQLAL